MVCDRAPTTVSLLLDHIDTFLIFFISRMEFGGTSYSVSIIILLLLTIIIMMINLIFDVIMQEYNSEFGVREPTEE